jgi:hypothetical protein
MAQQLQRSLYELVVIARIGSMKFLLIMNIAMRQPVAHATVRSPMRNRAGESPCVGACWRLSISDFGDHRARRELQ